MAKKPYIYGIRAIIEAISSGQDIEKIWIDKTTSGSLISELRQAAITASVPVQYVPSSALNKFANKNHQGAIAISSPIIYVDYKEMITRLFESGENPLILILDGVTDVRNFGAIARNAVCLGVHLLIIPTRGSAIINEDAIKTSAGALFQLPVSRVTQLAECVMYIKECGLKIIAGTEKATVSISDEELDGPLAFVLGGEESGVSKPIMQLANATVKIPISGAIDSLNVSVATGILLYETARQRGFKF
jgi:23S rRNA (guanosine2251-2'-O)-methyltransferase